MISRAVLGAAMRHGQRVAFVSAGALLAAVCVAACGTADAAPVDRPAAAPARARSVPVAATQPSLAWPDFLAHASASADKGIAKFNAFGSSTTFAGADRAAQDLLDFASQELAWTRSVTPEACYASVHHGYEVFWGYAIQEVKDYQERDADGLKWTDALVLDQAASIVRMMDARPC